MLLIWVPFGAKCCGPEMNVSHYVYVTIDKLAARLVFKIKNEQQ